MTDDELKTIEARASAPKWPALPATLRDTADVLSRFVRKKGDQNVIDQLQAAADEVEALRADSTALVAEVRRLQDVVQVARGALADIADMTPREIADGVAQRKALRVYAETGLPKPMK
jgi:ABC-type transporter Mla subunit MlaD